VCVSTNLTRGALDELVVMGTEDAARALDE
jgi:hypothetical protein